MTESSGLPSLAIHGLRNSSTTSDVVAVPGNTQHSTHHSTQHSNHHSRQQRYQLISRIVQLRRGGVGDISAGSRRLSAVSSSGQLEEEEDDVFVDQPEYLSNSRHIPTRRHTHHAPVSAAPTPPVARRKISGDAIGGGIGGGGGGGIGGGGGGGGGEVTGRSSVAPSTAPASQHQQQQQRRNPRRSSGLDPEDIKKLVLRLHRPEGQVSDPELMTEEERKIYEFLQRTSSHTEQDNQTAAHNNTTTSAVSTVRTGITARSKRSNSRVWTEDAFRRLSIALGEDFEALEEQSEQSESAAVARKKQSARRLKPQPPSVLPPIYRQVNRPLSMRQWKQDSRSDICAPLTQEKWEDLRYCRYLRAPGGMLKNPGDDEDEDEEGEGACEGKREDSNKNKEGQSEGVK